MLALFACKQLMEESSGVWPSIVMLKDKTIVYAHERHHMNGTTTGRNISSQ
jgi:hypothetical protein